MISILSGSVLDGLYRDIVLYHAYSTPMISILSGSVLDRLDGHRAISCIPNANDFDTE